MKKFIAVCLTFLLFLFSACNSVVKTERNISCEDVINVYQNAGFEVFHKPTTAEKLEWECYVKVTDPVTQDYIFFYFFETHEQAVSYSDHRQYNLLIWLFSIIFGDSRWLTTEVYNNIEIEYDNYDLYKPFKDLVKNEK